MPKKDQNVLVTAINIFNQKVSTFSKDGSICLANDTLQVRRFFLHFYDLLRISFPLLVSGETNFQMGKLFEGFKILCTDFDHILLLNKRKEVKALSGFR